MKYKNADKKILDPCCGSRMFWFDRTNSLTLFCDNRKLDNELIWESKDGREKRYLTVNPDVLCDVTDMPFADESIYHIILDPPHLTSLGPTSWLGKKYGRLDDKWENFITKAFNECWRVLKPNGTLIFKWSEIDIKLSEILKIIPVQPLYGTRSGKAGKTIWLSFFKDEGKETDWADWAIQNSIRRETE